jgi:hypothetical protein
MMAPDFTIQEVLAWARTKPADEAYDYGDSFTCALAKFGKATNRPHCIGCEGTQLLREMPVLKAALNPGADELRAGLPLYKTYGALVQRLEYQCPSAPVPASEWTAINAYLSDIELARA